MADVFAPEVDDNTLEVLRRVAMRMRGGREPDSQDLLALAGCAPTLLGDHLYLGRLRALASMPDYYRHSGHPDGDSSPRCQGCAYTEGVHTGWVVAIHERAVGRPSADPHTVADLDAALGVSQMALHARTKELRLSIDRGDALERRAQRAEQAVAALRLRVRSPERSSDGPAPERRVGAEERRP
jgi:hypothetical protein